jgi:hypothetical protein
VAWIVFLTIFGLVIANAIIAKRRPPEEEAKLRAKYQALVSNDDEDVDEYVGWDCDFCYQPLTSSTCSYCGADH